MARPLERQPATIGRQSGRIERVDAENSRYQRIAHDRFPQGNAGPIGRLPSLKALRAFETVARLNSVKAAADELCVTPSSVSRQIGSLEDDMGVALLKRDGRGCSLTEDGRLLNMGLEGVFTRIAETVDRVRYPRRGTKLRVSVSAMFASAWLIPRLSSFSRVASDAEIILIDLPGPASGSGQADVVIDWGIVESNTRVAAERLSSEEEEIFPACRPGVCQDGSLAGAALLNLAHAGRLQRWPDWQEFLAAVNLADAPVPGYYLSAGLLWRALLDGEGVALLCSTLARDGIRSGDLVRPIGESIATDEGYWIVTPRTALDRPEVVTFRNWLLDEFATGD